MTEREYLDALIEAAAAAEDTIPYEELEQAAHDLAREEQEREDTHRGG